MMNTPEGGSGREVKDYTRKTGQERLWKHVISDKNRLFGGLQQANWAWDDLFWAFSFLIVLVVADSLSPAGSVSLV